MGCFNRNLAAATLAKSALLFLPCLPPWRGVSDGLLLELFFFFWVTAQSRTVWRRCCLLLQESNFFVSNGEKSRWFSAQSSHLGFDSGLDRSVPSQEDTWRARGPGYGGQAGQMDACCFIHGSVWILTCSCCRSDTPSCWRCACGVFLPSSGRVGH